MNLALRFLSGIILLPVVLYLVYLGGLAIELLTTFFAAVWSYEIFSMPFSTSKKTARLFALLGAAFFFALLRVNSPVSALLLIVALTALIGLASLTPRGNDRNYSLNLYFVAFSCLYVGLGIASLVFLRHQLEPSSIGMELVYLVFLVIWSNDTFAYFFGKSFGKHKLAEHISQSKTWEGFIAGALFCVGIPLLLWWSLVNFSTFSPSISVGDILAIAIPGAFLGPAGDLIESRMKRIYGVKDSGSILPGHGGVLDRIDALLLLAPWTLCYAIIFHS